MSLANISRTVVTSYKADTSQQRAEIKKLTGEQKKAAKEQLDALEAQNRKLDDHIKFWGKVAVGVGAAVGAYKILQAGIASYQENSRVMAGSVGADLAGLRRATNGLVEDTDLLRQASKLMNGTFKLNNDEMKVAMRGALALRKTMGVDLKTAMDGVAKAVNEANAEALKPLGITIKSVTGTAETQRKIIEELDKQYKALGGDVNIAGDEMTQAHVEWANAVDEVKFALGEMAVGLAPIVKEMAAFVRHLTTVGGFMKEFFDVDAKGDNRGYVQAGRGADVAGFLRSEARRAAGGSFTSISTGKMIDPSQTSQGIAMKEAEEAAKKTLAKVKSVRVARAGGIEYIEMSAEQLQTKTMASMQMFGASQGVNMADAAAGTRAAGGAIGADLASGQAALQRMSDDFAARHAADLAKPFTDAKLALEVQATAAAFDTLKIASDAAFEALFNGSDLSVAAIKKMTAGILMALGKEAFVKALWETAQGVAALASVAGMAKAAPHFKAAALYGGVAVAAGLGSAALGGTGGGGVGGGGGVPVAARPQITGGSGGRSGSNIVILGENWDDRSPREREMSAKRLLRRSGFEVRGDVVSRG